MDCFGVATSFGASWSSIHTICILSSESTVRLGEIYGGVNNALRRLYVSGAPVLTYRAHYHVYISPYNLVETIDKSVK